MPSFAHIADCHLGAWRDQKLRAANLQAFEQAMEKCIEENVDFILITGDLFHTNIPDMSVARKAVEKMRKVTSKGIPIYLIYGSHDYSPNSSSIIDILHSTGLFTKVSCSKAADGRLALEFTEDPKTGAKITGISARAMGLEKKYFAILDHEPLRKEEGFRIFAFHTAIKEVRPSYLSEMEGLPASYLPDGMNYYAGGHVHERIDETVGGKRLVYPGPLFGYSFTDLERGTQGADRGFYIVDFSSRVTGMRYIPVSVRETLYREINADGKTSEQVEKEMEDAAGGMDAREKVVLLKAKGTLSSGKPSEIRFGRIRDALNENGAFVVHINRYGLASREHQRIQVRGESKEEIEAKLFRENIGAVSADIPMLKGDSGIRLAGKLLESLRQEKGESETKKGYEERVSESALKIIMSEV